MDNVRLTVFDIFSYMIPGLAYLILYEIGFQNVSLSDIIRAVDSFSIYSVIAYSFASYVIGFLSDAFSGFVIIGIIDFIRGDFRTRVVNEFKREHNESKLDEYHFASIYTFADVKEKKAREKADQFSAMSGLARNLSMAFLLFTFVALWRTITLTEKTEFLKSLVEILAMSVIAFVLMFRADTFRRWSHTHLLNIFDLLTSERKESSQQQVPGSRRSRQ